MKRTLTHLFIFIALLLTGCEGAKAPMGMAGEVAMDHRLFGTWVGGGEGGNELALLTISQLNESEYALLYKEAEEKESEQMHLKAFATSVNGVLFANVTCTACDNDDDGDAEEEDEWYFFSFSLESDDVLVATALEDDVYKKGLKDLTDSGEIRAYISAHMTDKSFFEDENGRFKRSKN